MELVGVYARVHGLPSMLAEAGREEEMVCAVLREWDSGHNLVSPPWTVHLFLQPSQPGVAVSAAPWSCVSAWPAPLPRLPREVVPARASALRAAGQPAATGHPPASWPAKAPACTAFWSNWGELEAEGLLLGASGGDDREGEICCGKQARGVFQVASVRVSLHAMWIFLSAKRLRGEIRSLVMYLL